MPPRRAAGPKRAASPPRSGPSGAKRGRAAPAASSRGADAAAAADRVAGDDDADADAARSSPLPPSSSDPTSPAPASDLEAVLASGGTRIPASGAGHGCVHDVARPSVAPPPDPLSRPYDPANPAKAYAFELDTFQRKSVEVMERRESVLVAAHTSAGKTVVAEYAIAMALRDKQRVVYTSPLKALSNQKFRQLKDEFGDVGLMTGDNVIDPDAGCLVMTTEILRSMLYKGGEVMREVGWVIFDEVHYMRDPDRGVAWEETIVMLPDAVRYAFLSATIPNAREFAEWIAKVKRQTCHIVYTDFRPTPLVHYLFPAGGDGVYNCRDREGTFRRENFLRALNAIKGASERDGFASDRVAHGRGGGGGGGGGGDGRGGGGSGDQRASGPSDIFKLVDMCVRKNFDPVIVFAFSKSECEGLVDQLEKQHVDLLGEDEKLLVDGIFGAAVDDLSEDDKRLPGIQNILPTLRRGVGVHHAGLLPRVKEIVELLFQENLVKVLFATETMSTGLNMPTKTVVFTSPRKFDGSGYRWISGGEYTQMAGRAGRRGLDAEGKVITMIDERMDPKVAREMLMGRSDPLNSAFKLSYGMLVNLTRLEGDFAETVMRKSFAQFQNDRERPRLEAEAADLELELANMVVPGERDVAEYVNVRDALAVTRAEIRAMVFDDPRVAAPFLQEGRLARVCVADPAAAMKDARRAGEDGGVAARVAADVATEWAVVCGRDRKPGTDEYVVEVVCAVEEDARGRVKIAPVDSNVTNNSGERTDEHTNADRSRGGVKHLGVRKLSLPLSQIDALSSVRLYLPKDLVAIEARRRVIASAAEAVRRFGGAAPLLDAGADFGLAESAKYQRLARRAHALDAMLDDARAKLETAILDEEKKDPTKGPPESSKKDPPKKGPESSKEDPRAADPSSSLLSRRVAAYAAKRELASAAKAARRRAEKSGGLILRDELKRRLRVLRRLGMLTEDSVVTLKGRVACEMITTDALVASELMLGGELKELARSRKPLVAALFGALVWGEGSGDAEQAARLVSAPCRATHELVASAARTVGKQEVECEVERNVSEYVDAFRPEAMEMFARWCEGGAFSEIMAMTARGGNDARGRGGPGAGAHEGSVVRGIRRAQDLIACFADAARVVGDVDFEEDLRAVKDAMTRDIVNCPSLFVDQ